MRRLQLRHSGRGPGSDATHTQARLQDWLRRRRDWLDRSTRPSSDAGASAVPLGIWHAAMPLDASRRAFSSTLWRPGVRGYAQRLDLSDFVPPSLADHGFDVGVHPDLKWSRSIAATRRLFIHKPAASTFLLRTVPGGRLVRRMFRLRTRAQRALALAVVVISAALLLSPGHVLRNGQVSRDCHSRRRSQLGQA